MPSESDEWVNQIHEGDTRTVLNKLPESSIHCVVTSPPYWGLRDYNHNDQIGLEATVEEYVAELVAIGRKLRRVLRDDGSWWLNLGDTYAGGGGAAGKPADYDDLHDDSYPDEPPARQTRFARKCKILVPHRVAIALIDDGWIVRSDAIWSKTNGMPSSVKDRLNEEKELLFHLTPQPDYWFDLDAIRKPHKANSIARDQYDYESAGRQSMHCPREDREKDVTVANDKALHPRGGNPGDVFEIGVARDSVSHFATFPTQLVEPPIKATCPPQVCAECGTPYERETVEETLTLDTDTTPTRPQTQRALDLAREANLTDEHLAACRSVGFSDAGVSKICQTGAGNNAKHVEELAAEAKDVLGGYFRKFCDSKRTTQGWSPQCECKTDATDSGIVLDPFAGAGTTCRVAKRLGRQFVGIEVNPDYVALAQQRAGIDVDEPERLSEDGQLGLAAFADGGGR
jgi:DNA modification methylase